MQTQILEQQLIDRWDTLPAALREAIVSDANSLIAAKAAKDEHLPEEKVGVVLKFVGYTLMGFIHPEDIAREIQDALGINPNIAASIANTLNGRIFNPLKTELEKIYAPAVSVVELPAVSPSTTLRTGEVEPPATAETPQPKILEEIKKPSALGQGSRLRQDFGGQANVKGQVAAMPAPPMPPAGGPKIISTKQEVGIPKPPSPPVPPRQQSSVIDQKSMPPGPVIIHQESGFEPIKQASGFKLEIPGQKFETEKSVVGLPPRPAQIEMGPVPTVRSSGFGVQEMRVPAPPKPQTSFVPPVVSRAEPRVVHYSEFRTPFDSAHGKPLAPQSQESGVKGQEIKIPSPPKPFDSAQGKPPMPPTPSTSLDLTRDKSLRASPPGNLPVMPAMPQTKKEFLPDPLKEKELPKPEMESLISKP